MTRIKAAGLRLTRALSLAGALALGGIAPGGPQALAQDGAPAPAGADAGAGAKGAPPVVDAVQAKPVDLTPLFRSLDLVGPDERVTRLLSMEPTTANIRDLLRLLADMREVEIEVVGQDGNSRKRVCGLPGDVGPAQRGGGSAADGELQALARAVGGMSAEQLEKVRAALQEGQAEFQRRLMKAAEQGEKDIAIIEKIGEELSRSISDSIRKLLDADQREKFDAYMKERLEDAPAPPGGARPRPPAEPPTPTARPA